MRLRAAWRIWEIGMADDGLGPAVEGALPLRRRVTYSEAIGDAILARVMRGETVKAICADPGMPHRTTVREWAKADPDFGGALLSAVRTVRIRQRLAEREKASRPRDNRGRWSTYTKEMGEAICDRLANGESLRSIGRDPQMPSFSTVMHWVRRHREFEEMYITAREMQADYLFDEARDVALAATPATVWVGRLQFDVIRWQAAKLAPRKYVERLVVAQLVAQAKAAQDDEDGVVRFLLTSFERSPKDPRKILAYPPRNAQEAAAYLEAYGEPYSGPGYMTAVEDWRLQQAHHERRRRRLAQLGREEDD